MGMRSKADVQELVSALMRRRGTDSLSQVAREAGIHPATFQRMMEPHSPYQGKPGPWRALARYLKRSEAEVLAAVGLGPPPEGLKAGADPETFLRSALRYFGVPDADHDSLVKFAEALKVLGNRPQPMPC